MQKQVLDLEVLNSKNSIYEEEELPAAANKVKEWITSDQ